MGEHQVGEFAFVPEIAGALFLLFLIGAVLLQHFHHVGSWFDDPGLSVFQRPEVELASLSPRLAELLFHMDHAMLEVHAVPGQTDQLAAAHPCKDVRQEQRLKFFSAKHLEELFLIRCVQRLHLLLHYPGDDACAGGVAQ